VARPLARTWVTTSETVQPHANIAAPARIRLVLEARTSQDVGRRRREGGNMKPTLVLMLAVATSACGSDDDDSTASGGNAGASASAGAAQGGSSGFGGGAGSGGGGNTSSGGAGSGGTGGSAGSSGQSCGGDVCGADEFCCGPAECGWCANNQTGPFCPETCDTPSCGTCAAGQICQVQVTGPSITSAECVSNPCLPAALDCSCAAELCQAGMCSVQNGELQCVQRCASPGTPIATPAGDRPIAELRVGDLVYSHHLGRIQAVRIRQVQRSPVRNHAVMRVELQGGATLTISPGHPTADGRNFHELHAGDRLDAVEVLDARLIAYGHAYTYDILPDSDSGTYFAGGVLIGSTLTPASVWVEPGSALPAISLRSTSARTRAVQ
jgi:hypothetical protein